jgi:hypothetical protein
VRYVITRLRYCSRRVWGGLYLLNAKPSKLKSNCRAGRVEATAACRLVGAGHKRRGLEVSKETRIGRTGKIRGICHELASYSWRNLRRPVG